MLAAWASATRNSRPTPSFGRAWPAAPSPSPKARIAPAVEPETARQGKAKNLPPAKPAPKPGVKPAPAARGETLDRQTARQLERGKLPVEARLDLHGMRQREAHAALRRFLKSAQGKGHRHVLVITGKGAAADTTRPFYESDERGVLRQAVPHWLAAPDLAPVVLSYSEAPRRLGGEGALYVRLRKG